MKARIALVSLVVVLFCLLASNGHAVMHRVIFNAWTQNVATSTGGTNRSLAVWIQVIDDESNHPPDFLKEIRIAAPDGSMFYLNLSKDWYPWDRVFFKTFRAADFVGKAIPSGDYTVRVTHNDSSRISETDNVTASFLAPAVVVYPSKDLAGVPETPTFSWNSVSGATYYKIWLVNMDEVEPVYYSVSYGYKDTNKTSYKIPPGDLKPNTSYRMRIEARSGSQDIDKRSRTDWIYFETGAW